MFRLIILLRKRRNQVSRIGEFFLDAANFTDRSVPIAVRACSRCARSNEVVVALYDCRFAMVLRILDKSSLKLGLPELGFLSDDQGSFERLIRLADGILLVTGPTGSGKTTTLYAFSITSIETRFFLSKQGVFRAFLGLGHNESS